MNLSADDISAGGMDTSLPILSLSAAAVVGAAVAVPKLHARLALSRAKHRSLTGHSKMSKRVARLLPHYEFDINDFFRSDGAPTEVATRRQDGFFRLAALYKERFPRSRQTTAEAAKQISDLQFTQSYRVPFQYNRLVRENLGAGSFVQSSSGVTITDLDGNVFYDLTGSYGVNIFGNDFYKECIENAEKRARALGPVLGAYHPVVADNVRRLCEISGLDEVSFHMSGTEAVMQAVRLARYHTRRTPIWCVSPAPITAGGAMCSRASAIRFRRTKPTRSPTCPNARFMCSGQGATLPASWSIRCRGCIPMPTRRAIPRWSTARAVVISIGPPTPSGSNRCARSAPSAASY